MRLEPMLYCATLSLQLFLILVDLSINAAISLVKFKNTVLLAVYLVQIVCLVFAFIILLITFFNTYVCRAGLVELLYQRFKFAVIVCVVYICLTISLNIWVIVDRWDKHYKNPNYTGFQLALFAIQRFWSAIYYYSYKRAALRISDPRFYTEIDALQRSKY